MVYHLKVGISQEAAQFRKKQEVKCMQTQEVKHTPREMTELC